MMFERRPIFYLNVLILVERGYEQPIAIIIESVGRFGLKFHAYF